MTIDQNSLNIVKTGKILIIDDNVLDLEIASMVLSRYFFVQTQTNSELCLNTIEQAKPDIILLDIMMPHMDGNQLLTAIRGRWSPIELPVIMLTGKSDANDIVAALSNGANDYIVKPAEFVVAIKRIQTHLAITKLSKAMTYAKKREAINATITTYNHEINNPLVIAIMHASSIRKENSIDPHLEKLEIALHRIDEVVKKTSALLENDTIDYETYIKDSQMLKL